MLRKRNSVTHNTSFSAVLFVATTAFVLIGCSSKPTSPVKPVPIHPDPPVDELATWNPANDWIAYEHTNKGWGDTDASGLYLIRSNGTGKYLLVERGQAPCWDSTGILLAYSHATGIWTYDFQSSVFTNLVVGQNLHYPSFPSNGKLLLYTDDGILHTYNFEDNSIRVVQDSAGDPIHALSAQWSPTGWKMVVRGWYRGAEIWLFDYEDRTFEPLAEIGRYPRWSKNGREISYFNNPTTIILNLRDADSTIVENLYAVDFSPSGEQVVGTWLVGRTEDPSTLRYRLFVYDLSGGSYTQLTQ